MKDLILVFCAAALSFGISANTTMGQSTSPQSIGGSAIDAPQEKTKPVKIPKVSNPPVIDGTPNEDAWKSAAVFKDFYQVNPGYNVAPSKPTEAYVMYDERNLYIAFKCWDDPDKIRASIAKRDNVLAEDNVRVWLDTYNDRRRAYLLGFNPLGIQQDGIFTEGQGTDYSVDIVMDSKGVSSDWGWTVEIRIPFKSLRYAPGKGRMWGFNVARNINRFNDETDQWLPDNRNISGTLIKQGRITGLDDIKAERSIEITPSVTLSETGRRSKSAVIPSGSFINQPMKKDIGVTLKYRMTPNITLDATLNPDFAEIEADTPVITANQRFPIFFTEKRPFFLEGSEIFQSPLRVFSSRAIVDPDFAVKLSGKIGKTSFGFLTASDNAPGNYSADERNSPTTRPKIDRFLDKNAMFAVIRLKRDLGKENNFGGFFTYRNFPEQENVAGGLDGRFKLSPRLISQFQVVGTNSQRCFFEPAFEPTLDPIQAQRNGEICGGGTFAGVTVLGSPYNQYRRGTGLGYYASLDYTTDTNGWFLELTGRSKDYRADSGFTPRTDTNTMSFTNRFSTLSKPKEKLIRTSWNQSSAISYDWTGRIQNFRASTSIVLNMQRGTSIIAEAGSTFEKLYEEEFGLKRSPFRSGAFSGGPTRASWEPYISLKFRQTLNKKLNYSGTYSFINNAFDFDFAHSPQDPGTGRQLNIGASIEYKPVDPLLISLNFQKSRLIRNDSNALIFDDNIFTLRSSYQFSRFIFARIRIDHDTLAHTVGGQLLFGWNPNPGTAVYVGYNDNLNYNGFNPFTGQREAGFARNNRTFFIRLSYLLRKSF